MRLVEASVEIGSERFPDVGSFLGVLEEVSDAHGVTAQAFDARYVVSERHLERALELADRERDRGAGIARDRGIEMTLYAAGRRQIDRALEMGVSAGETPVVVAVDGANSEADDEESERRERAAAEAIGERLVRAETLGSYDDDRVRSFYDIGAAELDATGAGIEALVLERVALLVVER
ncbi:KEOPS complex subunit Cgi121 [Natronomonas sp.]|uniref:KEOPS complex subunit Cgi121 n=1 Tax=Natronomonas sp. TaxID=2184060 RepID=UPI00261B4689|nr:KEOPS complex subunit Cgi121 [Natronomonas sp.]